MARAESQRESREEPKVGNARCDERRSPRANVLLVGIVECPGACSQVRVGNLSRHGALIVGDALPAAGTGVIFRCNGVAIEGCLAWVRAPYAGVDFDEVVQPKKLLRDRPVASPLVTKDTRVLNLRRPGFRGNQLTDEERRFVEDWSRRS